MPCRTGVRTIPLVVSHRTAAFPWSRLPPMASMSGRCFPSLTAEASGSNTRIPHRLFSPAWSPDGKRIVVADDARLLEIAFPSGERRAIPIATHLQTFRGLTWAPDGSLVASAASEDAGDHQRLWRIDPATGA